MKRMANMFCEVRGADAQAMKVVAVIAIVVPRFAKRF